MIQETSLNQHSSLYIYTDQNSYEPLARIDKRGNDPERVMYFHTDLNGCPEELTDENGKILWECSFQLWGKRIHEIEHIPIQQNLRYQGQYLDRETGLHYNTFRYYDPDIGRFTQPDPIGLLGGFNLYQYAPNGLTWIDPWGWAPWKRGGFDDWFNNATPEEINQNIKSVKGALRNGGGKHEMFPVSLAAKAKSLGFTAEELKALTVPTKDIYFVDVEDKKNGGLIQGDHHNSSASKYFHDDLIEQLKGAKSKKAARKIIRTMHNTHMRYKPKC
jgi:RHS repeat-associated protein